MRADPDDAAEPPGEGGCPPPLLVAAALVAIEGVVLVLLGVVEVLNLDSGRLTMGVTVSAFFLAFAALLIACGWGLRRRQPWARGPALITQVIALGLAWNFRGGGTTAVSIALLVVAAIVLAGILHPRSVEALEQAADEI